MLNPLNKLRRFANVAPAPAAKVPVKAEAMPRTQKPTEGATLPPDEIAKLINPDSLNCAHCKGHHTKVKFIFYSEGPDYKGWYCFDCWAYRYKHRAFPPAAPVRVIPKKVPGG